jgi:hypothetical protein
VLEGGQFVVRHDVVLRFSHHRLARLESQRHEADATHRRDQLFPDSQRFLPARNSRMNDALFVFQIRRALTTASILCGRAIALNAAVTMDSNTISNDCFATGGDLGNGFSGSGSSNNIVVFAINPSTGALTPVGSPYSAGNNPRGVAVNAAGTYLYVTNYSTNDVSAFSISGGTLTSVGAAVATGSQPQGIAIAP